VGNAVERNRAKRLIKEALRLENKFKNIQGAIIILARRPVIFLKAQAVQKELQEVFTKLTTVGN
jgi:ribonuclease P protein component